MIKYIFTVIAFFGFAGLKSACASDALPDDLKLSKITLSVRNASPVQFLNQIIEKGNLTAGIRFAFSLGLTDKLSKKSDFGNITIDFNGESLTEVLSIFCTNFAFEMSVYDHTIVFSQKVDN